MSICVYNNYTVPPEPPVIEFMDSSSVAVEGDVVTVCLSVVRGTVTTPTNITLTTQLRQSQQVILFDTGAASK